MTWVIGLYSIQNYAEFATFASNLHYSFICLNLPTICYSQHWYRTVTEWSRKESQPRYVNTLTDSAAPGKSCIPHLTIQVELNHGISSKYSEEVPIRIDSHNVSVQVNQALIFPMCLFSFYHSQRLSQHLLFATSSFCTNIHKLCMASSFCVCTAALKYFY